MKWERITTSETEAGIDVLQRIVVPGGWLYHRIYVVKDEISTTMVFVPDIKEDKNGRYAEIKNTSR